jgi:hypothetical protein
MQRKFLTEMLQGIKVLPRRASTSLKGRLQTQGSGVCSRHNWLVLMPFQLCELRHESTVQLGRSLIGPMSHNMDDGRFRPGRSNPCVFQGR